MTTADIQGAGSCPLLKKGKITLILKFLTKENYETFDASMWSNKSQLHGFLGMLCSNLASILE